ncbi:hypothetical protein GQ53DRAFT_840571 [Thozetella sp. PMI_491]|nr:hypothetical protein GQ53DRAFT_840571 [Thozetella sp. PMI_491]
MHNFLPPRLPCPHCHRHLEIVMVNPGHASRGCTTCKLRRIRCDSSRPICLRCTKSKRVCLGYDTQKRSQHLHDVHTAKTNTEPIAPTLGSPLVLTDPCHAITRVGPGASRLSLLDPLARSAAGIRAPGVLSLGPLFEPPIFYEAPIGVNISVLKVVRAGLYSLREGSQTIEHRRALLATYGSATRELSEAIGSQPSSPPLLIACFLFALYEMVVNVSSEDKTWRIHLDGLLKLLQTGTGRNTWPSLTRAMGLIHTKTDVYEAIASSSLEGFGKACLLLDVAKLRLYSLALEMEALLNDKSRIPRKLDVQKLHVSTRQIEKNLNLVPVMLSSDPQPTMAAESIDTCLMYAGTGNRMNLLLLNILVHARWNEWRALQITAATMQLKTGAFLHPGQENQNTKEFKQLHQAARKAAEGICDALAPSVLLYLEASSTCSKPVMNEVLEAITLLWPLYCAIGAPDLAESQRDWAANSLWQISQKFAIPKAGAIAVLEDSCFSESDAIAGLLLANIGSSLRGPYTSL